MVLLTQVLEKYGSAVTRRDSMIVLSQKSSLILLDPAGTRSRQGFHFIYCVYKL